MASSGRRKELKACSVINIDIRNYCYDQNYTNQIISFYSHVEIMLLSMNKVRALVYKRMSCTRQLSQFNRKPKMRLIEECWTDSHLLAPGIRELAFLQKLRESTGTSLKPSLASLERLQATCLYEKENMYAYVTTRALIDLYPEEFNKGGYLFSNSVESLHAMGQYESLNSLVTPAVWRNYTRKWKSESEGETSSSSSRVVSALLEATLRGGGGEL